MTPQLRVRAAGARLAQAPPPLVSTPAAETPTTAQLHAFRDLMRPHVAASDLLAVVVSRAAGRLWCEVRLPSGRTCRVSYTVAHVVLLGDAWPADAAITLLSQLEGD